MNSFFGSLDGTTAFELVACVAVLIVAVIMYRRRKGAASGAQAAPGKQELDPQDKALLLSLLAPTAKPYIKLGLVRKPLGVFDSKLGGIPYLPPGFDYPYNTEAASDKRPLRLLAQLNFAQLPHLDGYPEKGILQFYIAYEENSDMFGLDFDDPTGQAGWRVAFHQDVLDDESLLQAPPELDKGSQAYFPFEGEFGLEAQLGEQAITNSVVGWGEFVEGAVKPSPVFQALAEKYSEDTLTDVLLEASDTFGSQIGGYPSFVQDDPRYQDAFKGYAALLLQLDSWWDKEDQGIMWGDAGVANWFIEPVALANANFSDILYNWDCS